MKAVTYIYATLVVLMLAACAGETGGTGGTGAQGAPGAPGVAGPQGPAAPAPTPPPTPSAADLNAQDIQDVLANGAHGNAYRLGLGQTELSSGLSCQVQHIGANQCLSNSTSGSAACVGQPVVTMTGTNYTYLYSGAFDQPNASSGVNNLIPTQLQSLFVNTNYRIVCTGYIVIQQPGWYEFEDYSDDGSIIYLDGGTLYNDGNHAINTVAVTQSVYFDRDVHSFQVQYAQSGLGSFGLILNMNNQSIPSDLYFH